MYSKAKNLFKKLFFHSPKRTFFVVGSLIVALALPITVFLSQQQQDLRQRASCDPNMANCDDRAYEKICQEDRNKIPLLADGPPEETFRLLEQTGFATGESFKFEDVTFVAILAYVSGANLFLAEAEKYAKAIEQTPIMKLVPASEGGTFIITREGGIHGPFVGEALESKINNFRSGFQRAASMGNLIDPATKSDLEDVVQAVNSRNASIAYRKAEIVAQQLEISLPEVADLIDSPISSNFRTAGYVQGTQIVLPNGIRKTFSSAAELDSFITASEDLLNFYRNSKPISVDIIEKSATIYLENQAGVQGSKIARLMRIRGLTKVLGAANVFLAAADVALLGPQFQTYRACSQDRKSMLVLTYDKEAKDWKLDKPGCPTDSQCVLAGNSCAQCLRKPTSTTNDENYVFVCAAENPNQYVQAVRFPLDLPPERVNCPNNKTCQLNNNGIECIQGNPEGPETPNDSQSPPANQNPPTSNNRVFTCEDLWGTGSRCVTGTSCNGYVHSAVNTNCAQTQGGFCCGGTVPPAPTKTCADEHGPGSVCSTDILSGNCRDPRAATDQCKLNGPTAFCCGGRPAAPTATAVPNIAVNQPPAPTAPTLTNTMTACENGQVYSQFYWSGSASSYDLYYGANGATPTLQKSNVTSGVKISGFTASIPITWYVVAKNSTGQSTKSVQTWPYTTGTCASAAGKPTLQLFEVSCDPNRTDASVAFKFTPGTNATSHVVRWGSPRIGNNTQEVKNYTSGTKINTFTRNVDVEWQIVALDSKGNENPSSNGTFIQKTTCPASVNASLPQVYVPPQVTNTTGVSPHPNCQSPNYPCVGYNQTICCSPDTQCYAAPWQAPQCQPIEGYNPAPSYTVCWGQIFPGQVQCGYFAPGTPSEPDDDDDQQEIDHDDDDDEGDRSRDDDGDDGFILLENGETCSWSLQCRSGLCERPAQTSERKYCRAKPGSVAIGSVCYKNEDCESNICIPNANIPQNYTGQVEGVCSPPPVGPQTTPSVTQTTPVVATPTKTVAPSVQEGLTCDPVKDGVINELDFQWLKDEMIGKKTTKVADCFKKDGVVNELDFQVWKDINFNRREPF